MSIWGGAQVMRKFTIHVVGDSKEYFCYEGQRLLHAIENGGCQCINVGCREGGCGVCRVKVHSGDYHTGVMSHDHVSDNEKEQGYALSCRIFPEGDLLVEAAPKRRH